MAKLPVDELDQYIGKRLRKLRQHHKISAARLAEAMDTTQQQISRYENGNNKMSAAQLYYLASCLNVPISWFYLDYTSEKKVPMLYEDSPGYETSKIKEEINILSKSWPQLSSNERDVLLKLLDTFLLEKHR